MITQKIRHAILSLAVLLLYCAPLSAEENEDFYTVDTLISRALSQYELLTASKLRIDEFRYGKQDAAKWQNPDLTITLGRKSVQKQSGHLYGFSIEQNIPYPGKQRLREEIVSFEENRAQLSYEEMRSYVHYKVMLLAYEYAAQLQKIEHAEGRLRRLRLIDAYMRGRRVVSPQRIVERKIIHGKTLMLERELSRVKSDTRVAFLKLNVYTGLPTEVLPDVRVTWYVEAPALDLSELLKHAERKSYALRKQNEAVKRSEKELELSKRERYPDFGFSLFYDEEEAGEKERVVGGGISIPLPLLHRNRYAIERDRVRIERNRALLLNTKKQLHAELRSLFEEYQLYGSLIKKFTIDDIDSIEESMRYADREFRRGRVTLQTYLEMDAQSHELLEAVYNAQINLMEAYSTILFITNQQEEKPSND
jgi:cobalt-zinc-cadmium efflux system outer membrane protein